MIFSVSVRQETMCTSLAISFVSSSGLEFFLLPLHFINEILFYQKEKKRQEIMETAVPREEHREFLEEIWYARHV